jgi:hypothetical protein
MPSNYSGLPNEIREVFSHLSEDMVWLHAKLKVFRELFAKPEDRAVIREAASFAAMVIEDSMLSDIIITVCRMIEGGKPPGEPETPAGREKSLSLTHLLKLLSDSNTDIELVQRCNARYRELVGLLRPLKKLRNKVVAHRDLKTVLAGLPIQIPFDPPELDKIAAELADIMNEIDAYFTDSSTAFVAPFGVGSGDTLIHFLKRGIEGFDEDDRKRFGQQ